MSGSTRTVQVTIGIRQLVAAIAAVALAAGIAGAATFGQLTASKPGITNQGSGPAIEIHRPAMGGSNGTRFPQ